MAVYAAHLTRTLQGTPSVFQVTAQEALGATVKPALRKLIEYLAAVYPNKCGWCVRWFDELYLLFDCCLQYHYLKHYAASFSETFYGLLRVPLTFSSEFASGQRLPELLERGSLVLLVLVPYVRDKIQKIVDRWRDDEEDGRLGKSPPELARKACVRVHSALHLVTECGRLLQLARYLTGAAPAHSPELHVLGLALRDAPPRDEDDHSWTDLGRSLKNGQLGSLTITFPMVGHLVLRAVEWGAFGVQFLRWWESHAAPHAAALPPPPPPQRDEKAARYKNRCPLCLQPWKIPTALPVSGFVFCYVCVSRHVRVHGTCPVTGCPAATGTLVRLYLGFNTINSKKRDMVQLVNQWRSTKNKLKSADFEYRRARGQTGGGPPPPSPPAEDVAVIAAIPHEFVLKKTEKERDIELRANAEPSHHSPQSTFTDDISIIAVSPAAELVVDSNLVDCNSQHNMVKQNIDFEKELFLLSQRAKERAMEREEELHKKKLELLEIEKQYWISKINKSC